MATAFEQHRGTHQGRIASARATGGSYAYELGHALNAPADVVAGDYHLVSQDVVFSPGALLARIFVRIVPPDVGDGSLEWDLTAGLNGDQLYSRRIRSSKRPIDVDDVAITLENAQGPYHADTAANDTLWAKLEAVTP